MANTTNFGWETPDDTDLVKDGAAAMRTLGGAIDTSLVDLKGGTTGQNLRKATNTDMDFTWAGDATNTVIDAEGDLLVGDSADTLQRLAIGTTGQVLTVDTTVDGKIKWAAAAAGGKVLQVINATYATETDINSTTFADTGLTASITPSSATSKVMVIISAPMAKNAATTTGGAKTRIVRGATTLATYNETTLATGTAINNSAIFGMSWLDSPSTTSATTYKLQFCSTTTGTNNWARICGASDPAIITLMEIGA